MLFTIVHPYTVKIDAGNLHDAMRAFVKTYYHLKINDLIVKDYARHYQANLKYFNTPAGKRQVGINFAPYGGLVNPGPLLTGNVLNYNPYPVVPAMAVRTPIVAQVVYGDDDGKTQPTAPVKATSGTTTTSGTTVKRNFYMVSPVASPVLPTVPTAGPLSPFATRLVGTPVSPVMAPMVLSPVSPAISLFGQRIALP
jgi:hypothetical protein